MKKMAHYKIYSSMDFAKFVKNKNRLINEKGEYNGEHKLLRAIY